MIGKLIGGTFKIVMKAISKIPFIGSPLVNALLFFFVNLGKAIKRLPYLIAIVVIGFMTAIFFGII